MIIIGMSVKTLPTLPKSRFPSSLYECIRGCLSATNKHYIIVYIFSSPITENNIRPPMMPVLLNTFGIDRYALPKSSFIVFMKDWKSELYFLDSICSLSRLRSGVAGLSLGFLIFSGKSKLSLAFWAFNSC